MTITHSVVTAQPNNPLKDISADAWNASHTITPAPISAILSDHTQATHNSLNINAANLGGYDANNFALVTSGQTIQVSNTASFTSALAQLAAAPILKGNVTIDMSPGTYTGNFVIPQLLNCGYNLTLQGNFSGLLTTTAVSGTAGAYLTSGGQPQVVCSGTTWANNIYANKILRFDSGANSGVYRVIDQNTSNRIFLCGGTITAPNGDQFTINDWGTQLGSPSGYTLYGNSAKGLTLNNLEVSGSTYNIGFSDTIVTANQCKFNGLGTLYSNENNVLNQCVLFTAAGKWIDHRMTNIGYYGCKWLASSPVASTYGGDFRIGYTIIRNICVIEGQNIGTYIDNAGHVQFHNGYNIFRNCTTGVSVLNGGGAMNASTNNLYSGCTSNYTTDSNSWYS